MRTLRPSALSRMRAKLNSQQQLRTRECSERTERLRPAASLHRIARNRRSGRGGPNSRGASASERAKAALEREQGGHPSVALGARASRPRREKGDPAGHASHSENRGWRPHAARRQSCQVDPHAPPRKTPSRARPRNSRRNSSRAGRAVAGGHGPLPAGAPARLQAERARGETLQRAHGQGGALQAGFAARPTRGGRR